MHDSISFEQKGKDRTHILTKHGADGYKILKILNTYDPYRCIAEPEHEYDEYALYVPSILKAPKEQENLPNFLQNLFENSEIHIQPGKLSIELFF